MQNCKSVKVELISIFIKFVRKILIYYSPFDFVKYLFGRDRKRLDDSDFSYFYAIRDILLFSIKQQNEVLAREISDYIHEAFNSFLKKHPEPNIEFPYAFYEMIYMTTEELAKEKVKKMAFLEVNTVGGIWLLGEFSTRAINETTYSWLWRILIIALEYEREDMIVQYWQQAHQHISFNLTPKILIEQDDPSKELKTNEQIERERDRFLEFNYALGGLLIYKRRFNCIKRLFRYTTSIPPRQELLPNSMTEIFEIYFKFRDPHEQNFTWITSRYWFPELEGLMADYMIKDWVCKYAALLLIRQYTIVPHLITMRPIDLPEIPKNLTKKKEWIDNLDHLKELVTRILVDTELITAIDYKQLTDYWGTLNSTFPPNDLIEKVKEKVEEDFDLTKIIQTISPEKEQKFLETSSQMISNTIQPYLVLNNKKEINENFNKWFISGVTTIIDKSGFAAEQESEHINYDSFLAESLCEKFSYGFSETFISNIRKRYLVKEENVFPAIARLKINARDHIIVTFGQNLEYYKNTLGVEGIKENNFNNISLYNFSSYNYNVVGETLFVLKKSDLPKFKFLKPLTDNIEKYSLKEMKKEFELYGSVIDLNKSPGLYEELSKSDTSKELKMSVFLSLMLTVEIRWKSCSNLIAITKFSQFRNRGVLNELKDIRPFKETN